MVIPDGFCSSIAVSAQPWGRGRRVETGFFDEERFAASFPVAGWSFVRSTIFPFLITYTGVPVAIPSSKARFAARRKAREMSFVSRKCELTRRLINYLALAPVKINCGVWSELSYRHHSSTKSK